MYLPGHISLQISLISALSTVVLGFGYGGKFKGWWGSGLCHQRYHNKNLRAVNAKYSDLFGQASFDCVDQTTNAMLASNENAVCSMGLEPNDLNVLLIPSSGDLFCYRPDFHTMIDVGPATRDPSDYLIPSRECIHGESTNLLKALITAYTNQTVSSFSGTTEGWGVNTDVSLQFAQEPVLPSLDGKQVTARAVYWTQYSLWNACVTNLNEDGPISLHLAMAPFPWAWPE